MDRLKAIAGSHDQALYRCHCRCGHKRFLSNVDDIDDESEITCAEAVAELINGNRSEDASGYLYGYALQAICAHIGKELNTNIPGIVGAVEWSEEVDAILESKNIPIRLEKLIYGGSPLPIPEPDDYPFIGKWLAEKIPAALTAFASLDLAGIDSEIADTLKQIHAWLESASKIPGASLVGFLS